MADTENAPIPKRKQTNLETANAMFKEAFLVKKARFQKENPQLTDAELDRVTANYFRNLADDEGKRGWV